MPYDEAQIKVFPIKELKELASNMSVSKSGSRPDLVMRLEKSHAPMLKMLFDKCKKEKEEKKKEKKEEKQTIMAQGTMFCEKFVRDYNLKYVKSVTDAAGNTNHHYVFKNETAVASPGKGKVDPKTTVSTATASTASTASTSPKTKTAKPGASPAEKKRKREEKEVEEAVSENEDDDPHYSVGVFKARMKSCLGGDRAFLNALIKKYDNVPIKLIQKLDDEEAFDHCVAHMTGEELDDDEDDDDEDDDDEDGDDK